MRLSAARYPRGAVVLRVLNPYPRSDRRRRHRATSRGSRRISGRRLPADCRRLAGGL